jgi:hypothetical protein
MKPLLQANVFTYFVEHIPLSVLISNSLYQKIIYFYCHLKIAIVDFNLAGEMYLRQSLFMPFCLCRKFATCGPTFPSVPPPVYKWDSESKKVRGPGRYWLLESDTVNRWNICCISTMLSMHGVWNDSVSSSCEMKHHSKLLIISIQQDSILYLDPTTAYPEWRYS